MPAGCISAPFHSESQCSGAGSHYPPREELLGNRGPHRPETQHTGCASYTPFHSGMLAHRLTDVQPDGHTAMQKNRNASGPKGHYSCSTIAPRQRAVLFHTVFPNPIPLQPTSYHAVMVEHPNLLLLSMGLSGVAQSDYVYRLNSVDLTQSYSYSIQLYSVQLYSIHCSAQLYSIQFRSIRVLYFDNSTQPNSTQRD